ncbi:MAG: hypothetical protein L0226_17980 [Acidobacteria bacterium]|nr:hypothetical protein [Acidobacteriota bacterium]
MLETIRRRLPAAIVLLSLMTSTAFAQQNPGDWKKVKKKVGSPVVVITKTGQRLDGKLIDATDNSLKVEVQGQTQEVKSDDVQEVRVKKRAGGNKAAWIGGLCAAGFAIGAAIGKAATPHDDSGWGPFGALGGGMIGAGGGCVIGAVIAGSRGKDIKEETIFRAP